MKLTPAETYALRCLIAKLQKPEPKVKAAKLVLNAAKKPVKPKAPKK